MSRKPRFMLPGVPQHVIQRGHNREPCFFLDDDYHRYLRDLQESAENNQVSVHAYVLMTNHVLCGAPHNICNVKYRIM